MNVLKITTTPIKLSMTSQRARLESQIPDPEAGIIQTPGHLNMRSENIKVNIDSSRARDSLGFKTAKGLMRDAAQEGLKAASDATAQYSRIGNQMMQIQDGIPLIRESTGIIRVSSASSRMITPSTFIPGSRSPTSSRVTVTG